MSVCLRLSGKARPGSGWPVGVAMLPGAPSAVMFCVLGPLRVEGPRQEIRIGGTRRRGVLLRLLASAGRPVPVDVLAEDVWDGGPPTATASTLQSHVSALRQAVGLDRLIFVNGGYQLHVGPGELDSLIFEADVVAARKAMGAGDFESAADMFGRALAWWRGPAFADASGAEWAMLPAAHLEEVRNAAIEEALEVRLALGRHEEVCVMAEESVAAEPLRERRWAALMLALYRAGRQAEALHAYQRLRDTLIDQLGLDPSPQLSQLEHDILVQSPNLGLTSTTPGGTQEMPAVPSQVPASRSNLPAPVASFVGRKSELAELGKLVDRDRLVTIVGTGGSGKTRLAIEVAASRLNEHRDGVWFVDLAELSDPAGVPGAVADAIGVRQISTQPVDQLLADRVAGMQALLVVDNCEHLVSPVAATVERMLEAGPGVRVLATSRQPIGVPGERVWQTPPISFPADPHRRDPVELASFDAVRLFTDRAGPLSSAGDVAARDLRVIAEITARLDGLPLAIELAAARAAEVDLDQLASVLQDRLALSWLGSRTAHTRQQTLAATIEWSYALLTPQLQSVLKRLSMFSGGFTLEAAGAVTGAPENVTVTVAALAERSLIVADRSARDRLESAAIRYRMLETIRQYCAGRIADEDGPNGEQAARETHSRFFAGLAQRASATLVGWHQGQWLTILEADHANLVAAANYLLTRLSRPSEALQMIVHLDRFWHNRGHLAECAALLQKGLGAVGQDVSPALRCAALNLAGQATVGYDAPMARSYFTQSIQIARSAHDDFHTARALWGLAGVRYYMGDLEGGKKAGRAAVDLARAIGDPVLLGECLVSMGLVGDPPTRKAIYQEALAVTSRSGDLIWTAWSHNNLGDALLVENDLEAAKQHLQQARTILREVGHPSPQPVANLGWVHLRQGNLDKANAAFTEALRDSERLHHRLVASVAILGLACNAIARHDWERAARLLGFADGELQDYAGSWPALERSYREQSLTDLERQLGTEFERYYDSGRAGDRSELIDYALDQRHIP